jgi:CRISPR-associated protein Csd1
MILQALNDYYRRKCDDPDPAQRLPAFGLEQKEIPFLLEITREGKLVQLTDTRTFSGKKKVAQIFRVLLGVKKSSGVVANLLWDTLEYVLGVDTKGKPDRVVAQHAHFVARIKALPQAALEDAGIQAVLAFLADMDLEQLQVQPAWAQAFEVNAVMSFRLHGDVNLVCQRPAVVNAALNVVTDGDERLAMCLVTGNDAPVQRLHAAVKGVWGAQSSGANIVSFNARAFESYGKTERQGENAPVSTAAAFAYTTALNHLLGKGSSQRIQVGDASTVFWADKDSEFESSVPNIFGEPPTDNPDRNAQAVQALFTAMQSGKLAGPGGQTRFHMLGLAPNAARISIRFYHCLPLNELSERILQYFKDLELVRGPNDPQYPSLKRLLQAVCMSTSSQPYGDIDRVPPNLGGAIVDTVFAGSDVPYPSLWLNAAVGRCRAEQAKKTQQGKPVQNVSYLRAAAIKACLNRQIRRSTVTSSNVFQEKEFLPMLDLSNTNPAYRLGRLFAALEKIQEEASPGLNATIRDRYYGAASSTPVAVFTTLLRLKNSHLKKLAVGRAMWFEKLVGEILSAVVNFPKHMPLPDQGRFALGYYHQRQAFFTTNPDASSATLSSPSTPEGN